MALNVGLDVITRILMKVQEPLQDDACWNFTGCRDKKGYGGIIRNGKKERVIRIMWEAYNAEPIPKGMLIRHTCDNPSCVNPEHLQIGTHQDNMDDKHARGRAFYPGRGNKIKATY